MEINQLIIMIDCYQCAISIDYLRDSGLFSQTVQLLSISLSTNEVTHFDITAL